MIERNNHGHAVLLGLSEGTRYPNLFKDRGQTRLSDSTTKEKLGWATTSTTRTLMLDQLKLCIEGDSEDDENHFDSEYLISDKEFLRECLTFQEKHGKFEAAPGKHDDTIFAWGLANQAAIEVRRKIVPFRQQIYVGKRLESADW